jgi:hypothetical protein
MMQVSSLAWVFFDFSKAVEEPMEISLACLLGSVVGKCTLTHDGYARATGIGSLKVPKLQIS